MHLRSVTKPFELGIAARAFIRRWRARRAARDVGARHADTFASDPGDPVQGFDEVSELSVAPLEIDAQSTEDAEAAQDLAGLESEVDQIASEDAAAIEALETSAIENGADPDRELDGIVDDEDVLRPPHASTTRDTPIADHGSGGRRGL